MNEQEELKFSKIITRNCVKIENTRTEFDGQFCIIDIFQLIQDIDKYYKDKQPPLPVVTNG